MFFSFNARAVGLPDLPVETTIDVAADAGFDGVDLMIRDLVRSGSNLAEVRRRMDARGLRGGAFPMTMDWRGDEASFRIGLAELPRLAEAAVGLGLNRTGTWVMPETPPLPPGVVPEAHRVEVATFHVDRIGTIARVLSGFNIRLGLEVIGVRSFRRGTGVPFVTKIAELGVELGSLMEIANIGLLVDSFHLHAADEPASAALAWGPRRIIWAHIADLTVGFRGDKATIIDAERGLPTPQGAVGNRAFLQMLDDANFDGPITVEPLARCPELIGRSPGDVARLVMRSIETCRPSRDRI